MTVLYRRIDGFPLKKLALGLVKITVAATAMTIVLLFSYKFFAAQFHRTILHQIVYLLLLIFLSVASYTSVLQLLGLQELKDITVKIRARIARR